MTWSRRPPVGLAGHGWVNAYLSGMSAAMLAAPLGDQVRVYGRLSRHLAVWVVPPLPRARPAVPP